MKICTSCGEPVNEGNKFCTVCGAPISNSVEKGGGTEKNKKLLKFSMVIISIMIILCIAIPLTLTIAKDTKIKSNTNLGNKYLTQGKYEEAILAFEKIISIDKKNIPARIGIAKASIAAKNYDKAFKMLDEVLEIDKNNSEALRMMFDLYLIQATEAITAKKYDSAQEFINKVLKLNSKNVSFYINIADLYIKQVEINRAVKILETGIANINDQELKTKLAALRKDFTGNTPSNIINGGNVVEKDNWIYVASNDGIYRIDKNNRNSRIKLPNTEGIVQYLNIDKEYLYFATTIYSSNIYDKGKHLIMKVKLDGSNPKTLDADVDNRQYLTLKNGRLYYINKDGNIISMDTEGKKAVTVSKDKCEKMSVGDEWIYYTNGNDSVKYTYASEMGPSMDDSMGKIYRVKLDGSGKEKLSEEGADFISIDGNLIYYGNGGDGDELISEGDSWYTGRLYSMNLDGTNKKKLLNYASWSLNINGDWIYAYHGHDLVKINKSNGDEQIIGKSVYGLNITLLDSEVFFTAWIDNPVYDYVYYKDNSFGFYSIKLDKTP